MTYFTIWCGLNFILLDIDIEFIPWIFFIEITDYPYFPWYLDRKMRLTLWGSHTLLEFVI